MRALLLVAFFLGYSHQLLAQFSHHHHGDVAVGKPCPHAHGHGGHDHDHDHGHDHDDGGHDHGERPDGGDGEHDGGVCFSCAPSPSEVGDEVVLSFVDGTGAPAALPSFSRWAVPARALDHPPRR